jgi:spore germination cell wall hydrolase CwlJ-like protein
MKNHKKHKDPTLLDVCIMLAIAVAVGMGLSRHQNKRESDISKAAADTKAQLEMTEQKPLILVNQAEKIPDNELTQPAKSVVARYANVSITDAERQELAAVIYLEARNQGAEGQQAVAEVVLNRVIADNFPNTVHDVLHQGENSSVPQFSTVYYIDAAEPGRAQFAAIDAALYGKTILPEDVVYFSLEGENERVWGKIGDHVFCRQYIWE